MSDDWRLIMARYNGRCPACGHRIDEGEMVWWRPEEQARHEVCGKPSKLSSVPSDAIDEVYRRLADDALARREDLAESIEQMRRGEGRVVRPLGVDRRLCRVCLMSLPVNQIDAEGVCSSCRG